MIPDFDVNGNLKPGIHWSTWRDLATRFAWSPYRQTLLAGLRSALLSLQAAGCRTVYIDGSFVTTKRFPNDWDGCWDPADVNPELLDPALLQFADGCAAQRAAFEGHFYIASRIDAGSGLSFVEFFQHDRESGQPKGIIALDLQRLRL